MWYIPHNYVDGTCTHCGVPEENACLHSWVDGVCSICGNACEHNYDNGVCLSCGDVAFYGTWAKSYDDAGDEQINVYVIKDWTCKVYTGKYDENGVLHCCITADSGMTNAYQIDSTQSTGLFSNISVAGPNIVYLFDWEDTYEPLLVYDVEYDVMCDAMGSVKIFRVENFQEHLFEQNEDGNDECKLCGLELTSDWNTNLTATVA